MFLNREVNADAGELYFAAVVVANAFVFGTDDEAADKPPTPAEIKLAYRHEIGRGVSSEWNRDEDHGVAIWLTVVVPWSSALFGAIYFFRP